MTVDPGRPLSSVDLLAGPEHARLDELGNRAALAAAGRTGVDPGVVCRAGGPHAGRGGAGMR
ncbi:hypothetical protein I552_9872 [Mycobacterium xenopi 3993]|nr:hypothetical protein I552_9872 [Mycobacterium xenopi 3993]